MAALLRHLSQDLVDGKLAQHFPFFFFLSSSLSSPSSSFLQLKEEHSLLLFLLLLVALRNASPHAAALCFIDFCDPLGLFVVFLFFICRRPRFSVAPTPPSLCSPLLSRPVSGRVPAQVCSRGREGGGSFCPSSAEPPRVILWSRSI